MEKIAELPPAVRAFSNLEPAWQRSIAAAIGAGGFTSWCGNLSPQDLETKRQEDKARCIAADALVELADWLSGTKAFLGPELPGAPTEGAAFEPGTVVQLKSGGPKMVAGKTASDSVVSCYWANDMGSYCGAFPADCLQVAESPDIPSFLWVQTARLTEKLEFAAHEVAEAVSFAIDERARACFLYNELCKLAGVSPDTSPEEQPLLDQLAEKLKEAASLSALAGSFTPEQAELLKQWRATYFDSSGEIREAFRNVLRLRLWGHEIKTPELLQLAETAITTDTLCLLEALIASPDET